MLATLKVPRCVNTLQSYSFRLQTCHQGETLNLIHTTVRKSSHYSMLLDRVRCMYWRRQSLGNIGNENVAPLPSVPRSCELFFGSQIRLTEPEPVLELPLTGMLFVPEIGQL